MKADTQAPTGLYKLWRAEQKIWSEGLDGLRDVLLDDAIISGPSPTDRRRGREILALPRIPRPFETVELLHRCYHVHDNTVAIDYIACAKHPRFRRNYVAQCQTVWVRTTQPDPGWKIISHVHRMLRWKDFLHLTGRES